jgi:peptidase M1-like protein
VKSLLRLTAAAATLTLCASAFAATDPTYIALRTAKPDGRTIALDNFSFDRDVYHFTLNGNLHLLSQVGGKTVGAAFVGKGSYTLTPATPTEQHTLALFAGDDKLTQLTDEFDRAVFFDTALIAAAGKINEGSPNADAISANDDFMKKARKEFNTNFQIRVLREIVDKPETPLFLAYLHGKKYPPAILAVDPLDREPTGFYTADATKGGVWYSAFLKSAYAAGSATVPPRAVVADHYTVDTTIASNAELTGTTTMSFVPSRDTRVIELNLMPKLRIQEAAIAPAGDAQAWTPVSWIQENADEDGDAAIVLAEPVKAGQKYLIKTTYKGKEALENAGDGNFTVGARESWYANAGTFYSEPATFDLTFRFPAGKNQIIAVGNEVSSRDEGAQHVSVWKTTHPIRVAGFNYGKFKKMSQTDKDSGVTVDVFTNTGEPDIIRDINRYLEAKSAGGDDDDEPYVGPSNIRVDTGSLAQSAFADGVNTARTGKVYFGALADNHVAITQQSQWFFGQSWPGLVYLPYLAFVDGTTRNALGLNDTKDFVDVVGPHELAHQWWGHQVGWLTYHDVWLSEGFAEFTAGLVVQQTRGNGAYNKFWERKRKSILEKSFHSSITNDKAGPIWQGGRLTTWQDPSGSSVIIYDKGAYVVHMLRMAMQDRRKKNPDEDFIAMMTDFATTYAGKNASTADFQHIVEKHVTPALRLTTDGKLDWFFQEWVYGTAIPKFTAKVDVSDAGGGKYKLSGTVTQSEVPSDFVSVLPLYLIFDKGQFVRVGSIPLIGNVTKDINVELPLPMKPKSFAVNAMHDVLAR